MAPALALVSAFTPAAGLLAAVFETSTGTYAFESPEAERFRKLSDPEVVIALPALFDREAADAIRCQLAAARGGEGVRGARARLVVELVLMDVDAETYQTLEVETAKLKTDAEGVDGELLDFPTELLPAAPHPAGVAIRGRFLLAGGKKVDRLTAQCSLASKKRPAAESRGPALPGLRAGVGLESVSGTSSFLIDPPRKLKNVPDPLQLVVIPSTTDDTLDLSCEASAFDRRDEPIEGARWTILVELLVLDHPTRTFTVFPVAVESQVTDELGSAANAYGLPSEELGDGLRSCRQSAWIQAALDLRSSQKASELSSTCLVLATRASHRTGASGATRHRP